jgi:hypothetical protein
MATFKRTIDGTVLHLSCEPALEPQAQEVFDALARAHGKKKLAAGSKVHVGWTTLSLAAQGSGLQVREPDYEKNPERGTLADLSGTLTVLSWQRDVLARVGVEGVAIDFLENVVVAAGALDEPQVQLLRSPDAGAGDSGWSISHVDEDEEEDALESLRVCDLLHARPAVLQALTLPPGYLVVFDGDEIQSVDDPSGRDVWGPAAPPKGRR